MQRYEVIPEDENWEEAKTVSSISAQDAVEDLADWFWNECDGWEWMNNGSYFLARPIDDPGCITKVYLEVEFEPVFFSSVKN